MSNLSEVINTQMRLGENIAKKFDDLQAQITSAGSSKDTVAKIVEELRHFRELIFGILSLLQQQIKECVKQDIDTRSRRKTVIVLGQPEKDNENCTHLLLELFNKKLGLDNISKASIKTCHLLGGHNEQHHRPILVRFTCLDTKMEVWKAKMKLKGSSISMKEFLTKSRQAVFTKSRLHFGMRAVWTQGGVICIKTNNADIQKITTEEELVQLVAIYPKTSGKLLPKGSNSKS